MDKSRVKKSSLATKNKPNKLTKEEKLARALKKNIKLRKVK